VSTEEASPAGTNQKRKSPSDKENQENHPPLTLTFTITEEQLSGLAEHPTVNKKVRNMVLKEMTDKEKEKITAAAIEEQVNKVVAASLSQYALKSELAEVEGVVYGVVRAFAPATRIAMYEHAVYKFVEIIVLSSNPNLGLIRHQMVRLCNCVMVLLRENFDTERKGKMEVKAVSNVVGTEEKVKLRVVLVALQGLKAYIELTENDEVAAWDYDERNNIQHGGSFLKCLLSPPSTDKGTMAKYKEEVERVTTFENHIEEAVTKRGYNEDVANIEKAVLDIRTALEEKCVEVVNEKAAKKLAKKVVDALKGEDGDNNKRGDDRKNTQALSSGKTKGKKLKGHN